jgi:hypothetical protein
MGTGTMVTRGLGFGKRYHEVLRFVSRLARLCMFRSVVD